MRSVTDVREAVFGKFFADGIEAYQTGKTIEEGEPNDLHGSQYWLIYIAAYRLGWKAAYQANINNCTLT